MKGCKHLDYTPGKFTDCELIDISDQFPDIPEGVRYWQRGKRWTNAGEGRVPNPGTVQFCGAGRGRINSIFNCYNPGEMGCYEPKKETP
jgi:hypothetical protein